MILRVPWEADSGGKRPAVEPGVSWTLLRDLGDEAEVRITDRKWIAARREAEREERILERVRSEEIEPVREDLRSSVERVERE